MKLKLHSLVAALLMAGTLVGCGSSSDDDDTDPPSTPPEEPTPTPEMQLSGTLVAPEGAEVQTASLLATKAARETSNATLMATATATCPSVPISYTPIANATISFMDEDSNLLGVTLTTDQCGDFSGTVPGEVVYASTTATGYRGVTVPVDAFQQGDNQDDEDNVLSVLPDVTDAGYRIASLQWSGEKLYFTVTDTLTGKAVLGIPDSAVSYVIAGGSSSAFADLSYAASQGDQGEASVALALDGSSSMYASVYDPVTGQPVTDANGNTMSMLRMSALASHTFLDGKRASDEVGFVGFDHDVTWIDKAFFDAQNITSGGAPYTVTYPASGFSTNADTLRLAVDYYNISSQIWNDTNPDPVHAPQPADLSAYPYPWGGSTAAYKAAQEALTQLESRPNARKIGVLLSDGYDNASGINATQLAAAYQAANIPLWTVSFGSGADETVLQQLATDTGGNFIDSTDTSKLAADFAAIQTGIVFQYIGDLGLADFDAVRGQNLSLTLDYGGLSATRDSSIPAQTP